MGHLSLLLWGSKCMRPIKGDRWPQKGEPNVHRSCTPWSGEPNPGKQTPAADSELGHASHPRRVQIQGAKSQLRIRNSVTQSSREWPNPGSQIPATDPELGHAVPRLDKEQGTLERKRCLGNLSTSPHAQPLHNTPPSHLTSSSPHTPPPPPHPSAHTHR